MVFVLVFADKFTLEPAARIKLSLFKEALIVLEPTVKFLNMFWEEPRSVFVIVVPDVDIPAPPARVSAPLLPPKDVTPVFAKVRPVRESPVPAARVSAPVWVLSEVTPLPPVEDIVIVLLVVSGVKVTPVPAERVRVSVLLPAVMVEPPAVMFLNISWEEPKSEFVMVRPDIDTPVPAVRDKAPVEPPKEVTPVLVIVGVWPPETVRPVPAVSP